VARTTDGTAGLRGGRAHSATRRFGRLPPRGVSRGSRVAVAAARTDGPRFPVDARDSAFQWTVRRWSERWCAPAEHLSHRQR
jgi:hypothetical protein